MSSYATMHMYILYWRYEAMASVSDKEFLHRFMHMNEYVIILQYHSAIKRFRMFLHYLNDLANMLKNNYKAL